METINNRKLDQEIDQIIFYLERLKQTNKQYNVPDGYKIVLIPRKVERIQYSIGRFIVSQELTTNN